MVSLPVNKEKRSGGCGSCGEDGGSGHCGAGLEKIYPTTAVRYGAMNYIGEFSYRRGEAFRCGGKVVVQTDRGMELGEQVSLFCNGCSNQVTREQIKSYVNTSGPEFYKLRNGRILREATPDDVNEHLHLNSHIKDDIERCALLAMQMNLDMKVVTCEHLLGGERIVFYFRSEQRVDFRELVRELAAHYRTRIEMRQVGARDEARLVADFEICGRECCCKNFLKKMRPVSMKMAKVQKATLDPTKVSGRCGRLRCCLRYEHEGYEELMKKLPRIGSRVRTEFGEGGVVDRQILTQLVLIEFDDQRQVTVPIEEILEFDLPARPRPAPADVAAAPRDDRWPPRGRERAPRPDAPRTADRNRDAAPPLPAADASPADAFPAPPDVPPAEARSAPPADGDEPPEHRGRRRRGRGGRRTDTPRDEQAGSSGPREGEPDRGAGQSASDDDGARGGQRRRRRRRRRGGGTPSDGNSGDDAGGPPAG